VFAGFLFASFYYVLSCPDIQLAGEADKTNRDEHGHPLYIKGTRNLRDEAKALVKFGIDPILKRKADVAAHKEKQVAEKKKQIAERGTHDIAHRMAQITRSILNYACDSGLIDAVPMGDMKSVLPAPVSTKIFWNRNVSAK